MNIRILSVVSMFIASIFVGYNLLPTEQVQAQTLVIPSPVEMPYLKNIQPNKKELSTPEIDVQIDLSTKEVSVKGTVDAKVNVTTIGEPKPIVKWKTRVKKEVHRDTIGYPYVKSVGRMPTDSKPISILETIDENGKQ
jgi:hypothetical protein